MEKTQEIQDFAGSHSQNSKIPKKYIPPQKLLPYLCRRVESGLGIYIFSGMPEFWNEEGKNIGGARICGIPESFQIHSSFKTIEMNLKVK